MSENSQLFEKILEESNLQELKNSAVQMYQIYKSFIEAGFSDQQAMTLMVAIMHNARQTGV